MDSDDLGFLDIDQIFADQILTDDFLTEYSGGGSPSSGSDSAYSNESLGSQFVQSANECAQQIQHQSAMSYSQPQTRPPVSRRSAPPYSVKQVPVAQQNNGIEELPMKKARTPLREQRIHATESVQIIKVEPDCEIVDQKSTRLPMVTQSNSVLLKVEPTEFVAKPAQSLSPPQIKIPDILTQACHSIGMDSKGQFYRRSEAQKKAEERKIKNRHSASVSRERKKRHLEETETRNKILIKENEQLKKINKELMEKIRLLQAQIGTTNNSPPKRKRIMASTACLSIVFGLVFMTMPYAPESSGNISPVGGMENVHRGRRLFETNEVANESQFWLDDLVSDLRENHAFNELMYRAHFGSADVKKLVQRKLYEEFKISISPRRMSPSRFRGKLAIDSRTALKKSSKSSSQMCPNAASAQNLNEIHKSFKLWRTESEDINNIGEYNSTETGLVRIAPSKFWTHAELMESLSQIAFRNDTYYVLSNSPLPILAPVQMDNKLSPRMTFVIPAENTTLVDDHIEMHEIVCNVVETKNLVLYRGAVVSVEQEDDDTRIEIEV
ncbi:Oidioi.mRNA.OKI2018_I69.PAR.g13200.t1.cds [Oikopleura dioica]|uniref:Oidioi.mRNA.OKI2018_I69.PAR.g13200.t1.cds n=1 Tax=Oikopleura dioica TaxID=34765 RepID=A0ABN7S466_OIKDI|nr:Oidioi.mRNA.OKI2018_I69.PAR.g13200.t1.cds [Oikopleura dioica]